MFIFPPRYLAVPPRSVFDRHSKKYEYEKCALECLRVVIFLRATLYVL
jgi:hypothetical protein